MTERAKQVIGIKHVARRLTLPMLVLALMISAPGYADDIWADPLSTTGEVASSPAKAQVMTDNACALNAPIPIPLTLFDAVERALCRNPQARQAWANVKMQAAALGVSRAAYLPALTAGGTLSNADRRTSFPTFRTPTPTSTHAAPTST